jgi:hypothetical protein
MGGRLLKRTSLYRQTQTLAQEIGMVDETAGDVLVMMTNSDGAIAQDLIAVDPSCQRATFRPLEYVTQ